jgi:hypothetical protein
VTFDDAYYYDADGSQVRLHASDAFAVDWGAAEKASVPAGDLAALREHGTELRGDVAMVPASAVPTPVEEALDAAGALHPVFRSDDGALVVVLPEVRVEAADAAQAAKVREVVDSTDSEMVRDTGEQLVVRPTSQRGADALTLANRIEEEVHPLMTQARFLRVVPRPGT